MNSDIKKWLSHIRKDKSHKRKRDETDDAYINELTCSCIDSLLEMVQADNITNSTLDEFLENLLMIYDVSYNLFDTEDTIKDNKDINLVLKACTSISIDIIHQIQKEKLKNNKFNIVKFLKNYRKQFNIDDNNHIPSNKLSKIIIKHNISNNIIDEYEDETECETTEEDCESEEEYVPDSESEPEDDDNGVETFLDQLKNISHGIGSSKEMMIKYFNNLDNTSKKYTLRTLEDVSRINIDNIPYVFKILNAPLNNDTKRNIIAKIIQSSNNLGESGKSKRWVDDVMKLPFGVYKGIDLDCLKDKPKKCKSFLKKLTNSMESAIYGHNDAKNMIVNIMSQIIRNSECKGNVIGIWGPPGNGKTNFIKEGIAKAMDKPFIFISLGGAQDSSFLDGHSFTYEGSIYGRIAQSLIDAKCMNPIIYFDELDKVSTGPKGDEIINLLIHLIDPVQNKLFRDKYFYDIDIDLSKVTFIFSFNDPSNINYILRDRITMIETKYLTNDMKLHITNNYLLKDICKDVGIKETDIIISNNIISDIINNYTNEGGVRRLKEHLYKIIREVNKANLTNTKIGNQLIKFPVNLDNVYEELFKSKPKYIHLTVHKEDGIGMVNGLWANSLGQGGVLPIESALIPAKDLMTIKATGSLGEVIKESIEVALSVAWNKLDEESKNYWMTKWSKTPECFHIHCPDGSTGKEGPSAGAAMSLAFYSRLINKKVNHLVAMTGEINLREEVTEIGGLDEKLNAAKRGGAIRALIPYNNKIDLENVIKNNPKLIDDTFEVLLVSNFDEVIMYALY